MPRVLEGADRSRAPVIASKPVAKTNASNSRSAPPSVPAGAPWCRATADDIHTGPGAGTTGGTGRRGMAWMATTLSCRTVGARRWRTDAVGLYALDRALGSQVDECDIRTVEGLEIT